MRLKSHQFREHLGPRDNRDGAPVRFENFRIVVTNSGRANNDVWLADMLSRVTFKELNTHMLQAIGNVGTLHVRAGNAKAEIDEHLGNAGHADATDADE